MLIFDYKGREKLAYHLTKGRQTGAVGVTVIFLGGFMSDMEGSKALALEAFCKRAGYGFLRFDYSGHGASSGAFEDGTIGYWADQAQEIIGRLTSGPLILVGSSMGGWIASLLAAQTDLLVRGFVGIAAAPDFTERMWLSELSEEDRHTVNSEGRLLVPSDYGPDPYVFTRALFEDGRECSVLTKSLRVDGAVRLLQGTDDPDVMWDTAVALGEHMRASGTEDIEVILIPGGDHRLSRDSDLEKLEKNLAGVADIILTR